MRLTEKIKENDYWDKMELNYGQNNTGRIIDKLGQLEDIEEELGVGLTVIWKAIINGFYGTMYGVLKEDANTNNWDPIFYELKNIDIKKYDGQLAFIHYLGDLSYSDFLVYKFEDYGKTWALTKEELE